VITKIWNAIIRDRPPHMCKISAKSVQQFRKRCDPQTDRQTDSYTNSKLDEKPDNTKIALDLLKMFDT